jgi:hypothetical protein
VAERRARIEPVCGWEVWRTVKDTIRQRNPSTSSEWLHFSSQWEKHRSNVVALDALGEPEFFLIVEPLDSQSRGPLVPVSSFRVPLCTDSFRLGEWRVRQYEALPQFHRPAAWDNARIRRVAADVPRALAGAFERPADIPSHWRPMHGDLVPWNLREDDQGQMWLVDWEDAGWGPPLADLVRFLVAYHSLGWSGPARIAALVRATLAKESAEAVLEVARFWLQHHNLRPVPTSRNWAHAKVKDMVRTSREFATFTILATSGDEPEKPALVTSGVER